MLTNEEIKVICQKNGLTRGEVYHIRTQYASMCLMSEQWSNEQKNAATTGLDILDTKRSGATTKREKENKINNVDGISVDNFIKYCSFLAGSLPSINRRILVA
jgi:hypothetical protein